MSWKCTKDVDDVVGEDAVDAQGSPAEMLN